MKKLIKKILYKESTAVEISNHSIGAFWWNGRKNLGDSINYNIISTLSGKTPQWVPHTNSDEYNLVIGSILQYANKNAIVWGSGLISEDVVPLFKPKLITAVRGPKTRQALIANGISCPKIYGDPALLIPWLYDFDLTCLNKDYELGIIPHYVHKNHKLFDDVPEGVLVIDIETDDLESFVKQVNSCKKIVSSSLHGVIISDIYKVPCARIKFEQELVGGDFKFEDYYQSVGRAGTNDILVDNCLTLFDLIEMKIDSKISFSKADADILLNACPFIK